MVPNSACSEHPSGFDFNFDFWFDCMCGKRVQVPHATYDLQCRGDMDYPVCICGATIDISEARPVLRDLSDIDCRDDQVAAHLWYHSSPYRDWPSPKYRDDIAARLKRSALGADKHDAMIVEETSLALHLGTYAAAIENILRRLADEDSPDTQYWLHQVEIRLGPGELAPDVHNELSGWFGKVPLTALARLNASAVRYINTHEAPGSISLAIGTQIIARIRTIPAPHEGATIPATAAGNEALSRATAELAEAEQLKPDGTRIPNDQEFNSTLDLWLAEAKGQDITAGAREFTEMMEQYHDRKDEIRTLLAKELADIYLGDMATQLRERVVSAIPSSLEPVMYDQRFRTLSGLLLQPETMFQQFETVEWRTLNSEPSKSSVNVQSRQNV